MAKSFLEIQPWTKEHCSIDMNIQTPKHKSHWIHMCASPWYHGITLLNCDYWNVFQFVKKYGNLISLDFGSISIVIITGLPLIKEAFIDMEQNTLKRPSLPSRKRVFKDNGKFNWEQYWIQCVIKNKTWTWVESGTRVGRNHGEQEGGVGKGVWSSCISH